MDEPKLEVKPSPDSSQYDIFVDGDRAGFTAYRDDGERRVFTHTQVDDDYEGQGVGSALARGALDDTRKAGLKVVARCPFIASFIERHPAYRDLLAN